MSVSRTRLITERFDLGSLRLYREDLVKITTAVAEAGDLTISAGGFQATSPGDFDGLPERLDRLQIAVKRVGAPGGIGVYLDKRAMVELVEPDTQAAGILSHIRLICEPRRRRLRSRLPSEGRARGSALLLPTAFSFLVIVVTTAFLSPASKQGGKWTALDSAVSAAVGVVLLTVLAIGALASTRKVLIINAPRADRPTYWQRTRDIWQVGTVTTIIGVIAGYLLGKFT